MKQIIILNLWLLIWSYYAAGASLASITPTDGLSPETTGMIVSTEDFEAQATALHRKTTKQIMIQFAECLGTPKENYAAFLAYYVVNISGARNAAMNAARNAAMNAAKGTVWGSSAWEATWDDPWDAAWDAAWGAAHCQNWVETCSKIRDQAEQEASNFARAKCEQIVEKSKSHSQRLKILTNMAKLRALEWCLSEGAEKLRLAAYKATLPFARPEGVPRENLEGIKNLAVSGNPYAQMMSQILNSSSRAPEITEVTEEAPEVTEEAPEVTEEAPEVTKVTEEASEVTAAVAALDTAAIEAAAIEARNKAKESCCVNECITQ